MRPHVEFLHSCRLCYSFKYDNSAALHCLVERQRRNQASEQQLAGRKKSLISASRQLWGRSRPKPDPRWCHWQHCARCFYSSFHIQPSTSVMLRPFMIPDTRLKITPYETEPTLRNICFRILIFLVFILSFSLFSYVAYSIQNWYCSQVLSRSNMFA